MEDDIHGTGREKIQEDVYDSIINFSSDENSQTDSKRSQTLRARAIRHW